MNRTTQPKPVHVVDSLDWLEKAILHEFGTEETGWKRGEMVVARLDSMALFIQETEQGLLNRQTVHWVPSYDDIREILNTDGVDCAQAILDILNRQEGL